jgi:hypothetical protein
LDNLFALGLVALLALRLLPYILVYVSPPIARRIQNHMLRYRALLDVAIGTLMLCLVGLLLWNRAWIMAALLAAISYPTFVGLWSGLKILARLPQR